MGQVHKNGTSEKLYALYVTKYSLGGEVKKIEIGRACSTHGARRGAHRVLVEKPEVRRTIRRPRRRWEESIKLDLREVEWWSRDWIDEDQDRDR
jgi:hypothetical protein